ncbi:DMT family transporter [Acinetobacter baumannii]|uniref:DMT family transporter n=1 Tax=Acinetobacter baumannii TaxID=470 RepID=UPI00358DE146
MLPFCSPDPHRGSRCGGRRHGDGDAVWSGLGVVIITAIAWLLHGQKLDAWGFVGMGLIIAAFLLARSPSWKSLRRPTPW